MMSPWCLGGCSLREDQDPFHYFFHTKSAELSGGDDAIRHSRAAEWLQTNDLGGADPLLAASLRYEIPEGATVISVRKGEE